VGKATNYFIILTRACNLKCTYCGEDAAFEQPPIDLAYPLEDLKTFLEQDPTKVTIQFYGGEPLLRLSLLEEIMDTLDCVSHWTIQTNATHLDGMKKDYLRRISSILVSIDGRQKTTDVNRGKGIYDRVLTNCKIIRKRGFTGDLVARMTVSEVADVYQEVTHLFSLTDPDFDHVHWQLDSQWDDDPKARWHDFDGWLENSYNPGITRLVHWWLENMKQGKVLGIVPFIPLMRSILYNEPSKLRCGAGIDSFAINPDGSLSVCPISPEFSFSLVGDIFSDPPQTIANSMCVGPPCPACDNYHLCGGRCLFINKTKLWGEEGFRKVCSTVHHLIAELQAIKPVVTSLLKKGIIFKEKFDYPRFNNGCEIIP
jgi:putative peptide-modifying radical SAM enzyme